MTKAKAIHSATLCLGIGLMLIFAGCRGMGTQTFTALTPGQESALVASSQTVLDVTWPFATAFADYNLWENLSMLAPMPERYKLDVTLQVDRVVKGTFSEKMLHIHWLRNPTSQQYAVLGMSNSPAFAFLGFTNGTPLRIGFDGRPGEHVRNLKIVVQRD